jgi:hypothetical protein
MEEEQEFEPFEESIIEKIEETLKIRNNNGSTESEVDFIAGAMAALQALGFWPPPPRWVFAPMRGDSVLDWKKEV